MKTVRFLFIALALLLMGSTMQAQFGKRLGNAIENAAKNAAVRKAEQKTDEAVSKGIDKVTNPDTYKDKDGNEVKEDGKKPSSQKQSATNNNEAESDEAAEAQQDAPKGVKAAEMAYAKSDFVPGDEIMFDDQLVGETQGEFPSQWDLLQGNAEIAKIDGQNVINFDRNTTLAPLMKNPKNYLPETYTIEFDFYIKEKHPGWWRIELMDEKDSRKSNIELWSGANAKRTIEGSWRTTNNESRSSSSQADLSATGWHRMAISFNKRALKVYVDGIRIMNVPNVAQAGWTRMFCTESHFIRNFRIAKGAVPLYDRVMSDGKFITYGITFDVGKSTIKPESMGEINRIVKLMTDNPDLKFSVEGHTDATGNAASNQTLSEARSQAVVDKLVENGISKDRLEAAGKGQNNPISDNSTDEGRAKNRRVEFVKIN